MSTHLPNENLCRLTNHINSKSIADFNRLACAKCYELLQFVFKDFNEKSDFNMTENGYLASINDPNHFLDVNEPEDFDLLKSTLDTLEFKKWNDCCNEAKSCCSNVMSYAESFLNQTISNVSNPTCLAVWDGWSCHQNTNAGEMSRVKCPRYIVSDDCNTILDYAYFECDSDGWYRNNNSNYEWANYSKCLSLIIPVKKILKF